MPTNPVSIGFNVPFHEAIAQAVKRGVVLPDVYYGQLQGLARQQAFSIAGITSLDTLQAVKDSLDKVIKEGGTFGAWKKQMLESGTLNLPKYRLDNIYRTNLQGSYMAARWDRILLTQETRPYIMYDAINDSRVRPAHLALDGIIRRIDDPFWLTHSSPNGYRCRCSMRSLSEDQAKARSGFDSEGNGKGLNKQPVYKDVNGVEIPANPDKGWDYNPNDRLAGINRAIADKRAKSSPVLMRVLDAKLEDMKNIMPSVPINWTGDVESSFKNEINHAIESLPINVLSRLELEGCTIEACRRIIDVFPELKWVTPRGWNIGTTWENADGLTRGNKIVVAEELFFNGKYRKSVSSGSVLRHEAGHVIDMALGNASSTYDFIGAYIEDTSILINTGLDVNFAYFLQEGEAGRQETFAEIFSQLHGGEQISFDILTAFPKTAEVVKKMISET